MTLCSSVSVCVYVCASVYTCAHTHVYTHACTHIHIRVHMHMHTRTWAVYTLFLSLSIQYRKIMLMKRSHNLYNTTYGTTLTPGSTWTFSK